MSVEAEVEAGGQDCGVSRRGPHPTPGAAILAYFYSLTYLGGYAVKM